MYITINVKNKIAALQDDTLIINGNSDYVIKFDFDAEWDAYETKTARFVTARGYTDVVFSGDEVAVPVITDAISVRVGVYAGNLRTTTPAVIFCRRCITDGSGSPADPAPDVYAQLMELLNERIGIWYPTVDDAGNMSWAKSDTEVAPAPTNIKGQKGDKGEDSLALVDYYEDLPPIDTASAGFLYYCKSNGVLYMLNAEHSGWEEVPIGMSFNGGTVDNSGYLHLQLDGEDIDGFTPFFVGFGGGGGGSSSAGYTITLQNRLSSRSITAAGGSAVELKYQYASVDSDGVDDGDGIGTLTVNGASVATVSIPQGESTLDVAQYLTSGANTVKLKVENSEGSSRTLSYTVTVVTLTMTTTIDTMAVYSAATTFNYTVSGSGVKTVHILMDGVELGTEEVSSSGRSRSYAIPAQSDGAHILTAYAETTVSGMTIRSNTLTVGMMFVSNAMSGPAILTTFAQTAATQGEILSIPYMVYDPQNLSASVTLKVLNPDGTEYSGKSITAGREAQTWTVQDYPAGTVTFRIVCGSVYKDCAVTVAESTVNVEPVTDALALCFDPSGRSNLESNPASWSSGEISATFTGIGFSAADGWLTDGDGASVLRLLPGSSMTIPYYLFQNDARTSGVTVEVEMATHNVRDYDSIVMSCMSGNRGFKIASQYAEIASEQSSVSMQFKEDEKVRVSFVVEPRNLHRLIYVYVDGIMCGAVQYPENDDFSQSTAVGITVGAESSGIDVYKVRLYTKGLTRYEILDNYIADRPLLSDRVEALRRNDILDLAENIVVSKLPATLPYMIIQCEQLPQSKGDEKTCSITYVNPADSSRSFTAENVKIDVQGTSSAGYKKKNFKLKLKGGVTYTANNVHSDSYLLREDSVPATVFCMKADVASSESANNVELARLYNDIVPHKTSAQEADSRVRVAIDGTPCVIFWQNTITNETRFWGKYNFNFDKGASEVFGLSDGCESWETLNNTSNRTLYKSADFSGTAWQDDFEARYPSKNTDCAKLQAMCEWVVSTDRTAATGNALAAPVTYDGEEYTTDSADYRLAKFKAEFEDHFIKAPMLFYYLFTEVFLMVDSRAKNFFPTTFDGAHWFPFPYDFDTALGINNEGQLVFDYDLEDTDTVGGHNVFNGQASVLWCNIRDAFASDIKTMYQTLRSGTVFGYDTVAKRFATHQAVWPETVWNEDAWEKYLEPLENDNDGSYLTMLQGSKSSQREWWLFNAFRYRDSKYQCGDASSEFITLRCYAVGDITVTPYSHIWPRIKYGSYTVTERGKRNTETTLVCPLDTMDDTEVYIYSADRIASIGDLSAMQVGYANFSMATKLQSLKLGDGASTYENTRLTELYVGNNELLTTLDVQNCVALSMAVDLSGCVGIQTIKAKGSAATGFTLPVGGKLATLELPETITNLTIRDQSQFTTLDMDGYTALTTLRIENTPNVPLETIINGAANLNRVRLIGVEWDATSEVSLQTTIDKLETCIGMDASGNNTAAAVVTGRVNVPSISSALLTEINEAFPELVVVANGEPQYLIRFLDYDNSVLYRQVVAEGGDAVNPVTAGYITAPTRTGTEDSGYAFRDFGTLPTNVHSNGAVYAVYDTTYRVQFMNDSTVYDTQWIVSGESATTPTPDPTKASTAQYTYTFSNWDKSYTNITEPLTVNAVYTSTVRRYTVKFYNGSTLLQTVTDVPYGGSATYTGATPVDETNGYEFEGWSPSPTNITGDRSCYAQFASPLVGTISDSWEDIIAACNDGTYATKYSIGDTKEINLGTEGYVTMQIVAMDTDVKADGTGTAPITWISEYLLMNTHRMNPARVANDDGTYQEGTGTIGGWEKCEMRSYLKETIKPLIPEGVRNAIVPVTKYTKIYDASGSAVNDVTTTDDVWIPSASEIKLITAEDQGPIYSDRFSTNSKRKKKYVGGSSYTDWWTRTARTTEAFHHVGNDGRYGTSAHSANYLDGVALGFCT